ncbi:MAG TPA: hypothetical protein VFE32_18590 [Puia sp.]|jgi:hypothetical protein|nr:hypothetical protein [Puia sp.]
MSDLEASIRLIEETNNPETAYFSYSVDDSGEFGVIKANKEGLRLYAADLLKKSLEMEEEAPTTQPLFFSANDWMFSETGYNLIAGILPQYESRKQIILQGLSPVRQPQPRSQKKPVFYLVLMCITGALLMLATLKAFPNLRLWVNIH